MLRDAIFRYAGSVVVTQVEERHGIQNTAERNVRHFLVMSPLAAQYAEAFAENCQLDPGSWFEEDTPDEQLVLLDNLVVAQDVVEQMLLNGGDLLAPPGLVARCAEGVSELGPGGSPGESSPHCAVDALRNARVYS